MVNTETKEVVKTYPIAQQTGAAQNYPERDAIHLVSRGSSLRLYWITSSQNKKFECFKIDVDSDSFEKIGLSEDPTTFFNVFGATSLLTFGDEVVIGGNIGMSDLMAAKMTGTKNDSTTTSPQGTAQDDGISYYPLIVHADKNLTVKKSFIN